MNSALSISVKLRYNSAHSSWVQLSPAQLSSLQLNPVHLSPFQLSPTQEGAYLSDDMSIIVTFRLCLYQGIHHNDNCRLVRVSPVCQFVTLPSCHRFQNCHMSTNLFTDALVIKWMIACSVMDKAGWVYRWMIWQTAGLEWQGMDQGRLIRTKFGWIRMTD